MTQLLPYTDKGPSSPFPPYNHQLLCLFPRCVCVRVLCVLCVCVLCMCVRVVCVCCMCFLCVLCEYAVCV